MIASPNTASNDSNFSQQSSNNSGDSINENNEQINKTSIVPMHSTHSNPVQSKQKLNKRVMSTRTKRTSSSPGPTDKAKTPQTSWNVEHQQKLKQVQENKLKIALEIEEANLSTEVL